MNFTTGLKRSDDIRGLCVDVRLLQVEHTGTVGNFDSAMHAWSKMGGTISRALSHLYGRIGSVYAERSDGCWG